MFPAVQAFAKRISALEVPFRDRLAHRPPARGLGAARVPGARLSSTLAIFRIFEQIQWFSGSGLEALSPCFAKVFLCKWPKSSLGAPEWRRGDGAEGKP